MLKNIEKFGLSRNLNIAPLYTREQNKRYQVLQSEDKRTPLGPLARQSTSFISSFGSEARGICNCLYVANGQVSPTAMHAFGAISSLSLPLGIIAARMAHREALTHRKINNLWGEYTSWLKCVASSLKAAAGVLYLPSQAVMVALFYSASKTALLAASALGLAGTGLLAGSSLLSSLAMGLNLHRQILLHDELHAILLKRGLSEEDRNENALLYLQKRIEKVGRLEMMRLTSADCVEAILKADAVKAREIIQQALKENIKAIVLSSVSMMLILIGVTLSIVGVVCSGGTGALVVMLIGALIGLVGLGIDIYNLKGAFQDTKKGEYDRPWIIVTTIICSIATVAALALSQGLTLFILSLVIGSIWALVNLSNLILLSSRKSSEDLSSRYAASIV